MFRAVTTSGPAVDANGDIASNANGTPSPSLLHVRSLCADLCSVYVRLRQLARFVQGFSAAALLAGPSMPRIHALQHYLPNLRTAVRSLPPLQLRSVCDVLLNEVKLHQAKFSGQSSNGEHSEVAGGSEASGRARALSSMVDTLTDVCSYAVIRAENARSVDEWCSNACMQLVRPSIVHWNASLATPLPSFSTVTEMQTEESHSISPVISGVIGVGAVLSLYKSLLQLHHQCQQWTVDAYSQLQAAPDGTFALLGMPCDLWVELTRDISGPSINIEC